MAGIGGFSGRESDVSVSWLAQEVRAGKIRWVLDEQSGAARRAARAARRHAHGLEDGDGGGGEGVHGGDAVRHERHEHGHEQAPGHDELSGHAV